jgi:phosphatidylinositol kinase/protein kinase (PI-3  family)
MEAFQNNYAEDFKVTAPENSHTHEHTYVHTYKDTMYSRIRFNIPTYVLPSLYSVGKNIHIQFFSAYMLCSVSVLASMVHMTTIFNFLQKMAIFLKTNVLIFFSSSLTVHR